MDTASADVEDEALSIFTGVFYQFKAFSSHSHKLKVIWHLRFFVKCSTIAILLLLGKCHYENGVFDNSEFAGLHLAVLFISLWNSIRQLMVYRRHEAYFKDVSDAFETMTKKLSKWCHATNPSFAKILILLLEEMTTDTNIYIKSNEFISLVIFDAIIWLTNTTCLFVSVLYPRQLYYIIFLFFVITLVTVAMEYLLVDMKKKLRNTNEDVTEEIDKIRSIISTQKDGLDNTTDSFGKTKNDDSINTESSLSLEEPCGEKAHSEKTIKIHLDHELKNEVTNEISIKENYFENHKNVKISENKFDNFSSDDKQEINISKLNQKENDHRTESTTTDAQDSDVLQNVNQEQEENVEMDQDPEFTEDKTHVLPIDNKNYKCEENSNICLTKVKSSTKEIHNAAQQSEYVEKDEDPETIAQLHAENCALNNESVSSKNQYADVDDENQDNTDEQNCSSLLIGSTNKGSENLSSVQKHESMTADPQVLPKQQLDEKTKMNQDSEMQESKTCVLPKDDKNDLCKEKSNLSQNQDTDPEEDERNDNTHKENSNSVMIGNTNSDSEKFCAVQTLESLTNEARDSIMLPNVNQEVDKNVDTDKDFEISENKTCIMKDDENDVFEEDSSTEAKNTAKEMHNNSAEQFEFEKKVDNPYSIELQNQNLKEVGLNSELNLSENKNADLVEDGDCNASEIFHLQQVKKGRLNDESVSSKNQDADSEEDDKKNDTQGQNLDSSLTESNKAGSENLSTTKNIEEFSHERKKAEIEKDCDPKLFNNVTSSILKETFGGESAAYEVTCQSEDMKNDTYKLPVSKKDESVSAACLHVEVPGSVRDGKHADENRHSDFVAADECGDHVHFILNKCIRPHKNETKHTDTSEMKISPQNELQITEKVSSNTVLVRNRKVVLTYGKFHFSMDLQPESEIDLVFNMSGKSMKKSHKKMTSHEENKRCKKEK